MNCLENPIGDQMPKLRGNNLDTRFFEEFGEINASIVEEKKDADNANQWYFLFHDPF